MQGLTEITRQSVLFPVYYQDGETWEERQKRVQDMQYVVKDDLLYACIGWINEIDSGKKIAGMRQSKWTVGYVVLLMALREAFDLHRFPFCEDRILSDLVLARSSVAEEFLKLLPELTSERITELTHEVAQLYHHTQHQLEKANVKTVRLRRRLYDTSDKWVSYHNNDVEYAKTFVALKHAAELLGLSHVEVDLDTLNSFGDDGGYAHFPVELTLEVPANDVLYCANLIANRNKDEEHYDLTNRGDVEEGEWVVINRSPTGVMKIPTDAIKVDDKWIELRQWLKSKDRNWAKKFLAEYSPVKLRGGNNHRRHIYPFTGSPYQLTRTGRYLEAAYHLREAWRAWRGQRW